MANRPGCRATYKVPVETSPFEETPHATHAVLTGEKMVSETKKETKRIKAAPMSHLCLLPARDLFWHQLGSCGGVAASLRAHISLA
jgi:hypothetical protein